MSLRKSWPRTTRWLAPLGWLAAAVFLGLWVAAPLARLDPRAFAWGTGLCAAFAALSHLAFAHHPHASGHVRPVHGREPRQAPWHGGDYGRWRRPMTRHASSQYKGRSHSGERPRFD